MNKKLIFSLSVVCMVVFMFIAMSTKADDPTPSAFPSHVETHLRLDIEKNTKEVHFINTNNDPDVYTKVYVLKHADPYEIRPYLMSAVYSERVDTDSTKVECIKYNDGTGMLVISAEGYRFSKEQNGGMSFDEIVAKLDKPKISSSSGQSSYIYFPKYLDSNTLATLTTNVGFDHRNDLAELEFGRGRVDSDQELNALIFDTPAYNVKSVYEMLELYDVPIPELKISYSVYELNFENDNKIGADFQAWKNGDGAGILTMGGRWRRNYNATLTNVDHSGFSKTKFVHFSPKWNSKYLDFLTAKSKARVITSGDIIAQNQQTSLVMNQTEIPAIIDGDPGNVYTFATDYMLLQNETFDLWEIAAPAGGDIRVRGTDSKGTQIDLAVAFNGTMSISRINNGQVTSYYLKIQDPKYTPSVGFIKDSKFLGTATTAYSLSVQRYDAGLAAWVPLTNWQTDLNPSFTADNARLTANNAYGFALIITPSICTDSTTLSIFLSNNSLVGFEDSGEPRISSSNVTTEVMISNSGSKFVIGGLEKKTIVKSVSKVPWLGSIPILGWVLGSDAESTKKTQLVTVLECVPSAPAQRVPDGIMDDIEFVKDKVKNAGETNDFLDPQMGFDQFHFDSEKDKQGLAPAP